VRIEVFRDKVSLGNSAARLAAAAIRRSIEETDRARIVAATGASQFEFLDALTQALGVDWKKVEMFHLDEYVGLPLLHQASFRRYLLERLVSKTGIEKYHLLDGEGDLEEVCRRIGGLLTAAPIDVAFAGIGENGHLAFNDPPADFETEEPYLIVALDEACRRQQAREGWFSSTAEVPDKAISMSIRQILKSKQIICVVPDERKSGAVKACFQGRIGPEVPASILRTHPNTTVFLDEDSSRLLRPETISRFAHLK
jgi:glucosamine-6-phosphate deaminase